MGQTQRQHGCLVNLPRGREPLRRLCMRSVAIKRLGLHGGRLFFSGQSKERLAVSATIGASSVPTRAAGVPARAAALHAAYGVPARRILILRAEREVAAVQRPVRLFNPTAAAFEHQYAARSSK